MTADKHSSFVVRTVAIILLVALVGCAPPQPAGVPGGHGDGDALFPRLPRVTGHIDRVEANPVQPRHFRILQITDRDGRQWQFQSEGWAGVSVGHLKDHQLQGTPVTVWYETAAGGRLVARFVSD